MFPPFLIIIYKAFTYFLNLFTWIIFVIRSIRKKEEWKRSKERFGIVDIDNNKYLILKKKITVFYIVKKFIYYLIFIGLLLSFEFAFFQYIVLKYEPLSDNELQFILFNEIKESIVS